MAYDIQLVVQIDQEIKDFLAALKASDQGSISSWVRGAIRDKAGLQQPSGQKPDADGGAS